MVSRCVGRAWVLALYFLLLVAVVAACGQPPPEEDEGGTGENTAGGGETTAGETTAQEPLTPGEGSLVIYSGRSEELVGPIFEQFEEQSGIDVQVRYGETAELAATILEEGENSPADLFFAQDPGALGALDDEGRLTRLPDDILDRVPARFRADDGDWVGTSGRARVVAYNTEELSRGGSARTPSSTSPTQSGRAGSAGPRPTGPSRPS